MEFEFKSINRQPNSLTMSKQNFDALEKRLLYLVVNQLEAGINIQQSIFKEDLTVSVPIKFMNNKNYNLIRNAAETLQTRQIWIKDDPKSKEFTVITPFPEIKVKNSILHVTLYKKTIKYFIELKQGYTSYQLKNALSLNSKFSQRFYEMISRFKDTGHWGPIKISELKELLSIENKYNKDASMFKKRVLDIARSEILEKTELGFNYELIKKGKKYTHISFTIYKQRRNANNTDQSQQQSTKQQACIHELNLLGITDSNIINSILHDHQTEFWSWLHSFKTGKFSNVKNPAGYLLTTLGIKG